ncbi:MAG: phosphoribosylformylglycinamidine synthase subunit PurL [Armatimonadetes bacterium]|nr:phosphoribosylformylglycinamidine synthase subunit PurL [Armatimonadota bacterium]
MSVIEPEIYRAMGVTDFEFNLILGLLQRVPTHTELGMFAVMWSEHCGYKFSRPVLARFKKYKEAMDGDGLENAGIVPIGGGLGITMKVESHNHPSAVEPYQGAATGVGGILRDIFTMGARPIACLNSLRFGPIVDGEASPEVVQRNRYLFRRVVAGIGGYGNCVGVPTVGGEVFFHPRYSGNPLVNAMAVGILKLDEVTTAGAAGIGNPVIYLGSSTGKDGIHGATFASDTLGEDNEAKRPNVQIGDPFAEKLLIEATLEALKTGAVVAIQDMGAAGLTCSTIEMSSKGGVGMDVNLDLVPAREDGMTGYELMLSESQERMLAVAHLGREHEVIDVFKKWGIHAVVIGTVTNTGVVKITRNGIVEAEVNPKLLTDHCPTYRVESEIPDYYFDATEFEIASVKESDPVEALKKIVASPNIASKRWVFQQYDQEVQTQTAVLPGQGDAAVLALRGTQKAISLSIDGNGRQVYFDPYRSRQRTV